MLILNELRDADAKSSRDFKLHQVKFEFASGQGRARYWSMKRGKVADTAARKGRRFQTL